MLDPTVVPAFLVAVLVILATPGPDMAFMIATGINHGRRAAIRAACGVTVGVSVWIAVTATGLGVTLTRVPTALNAIRLVGALYLAYLSLTAYRHAGRPIAQAGSSSHVFRRGFIVNITNPKIALFFMAFVPQFLGSTTEEPTLQIIMLGLLLQLTGLAVDLGIGCGAGLIRDAVLSRRRVRILMDTAAGTVYAALAGALVIEVVSDMREAAQGRTRSVPLASPAGGYASD